MIIWPEKDPAETFAVRFDFGGELDTGETVVSASMQIAALRGVDAAAASVLSGPAVLQGDHVLQTITGGVSGVVYALRCVVQTSAGQVLARAARLPVMAAERW